MRREPTVAYGWLADFRHRPAKSPLILFVLSMLDEARSHHLIACLFKDRANGIAGGCRRISIDVMLSAGRMMKRSFGDQEEREIAGFPLLIADRGDRVSLLSAGPGPCLTKDQFDCFSRLLELRTKVVERREHSI
jgi:hypothetical protein